MNFDEIVTDLKDPLRSEVNIEHVSSRRVELLVEREWLSSRWSGGDGIGARQSSTS